MFYPWFIFNVPIHLCKGIYKGRTTRLVEQFVHYTVVPSWERGLEADTQPVLSLSCMCLGRVVSQNTIFQFLSHRCCLGQQQFYSWEGCLVTMLGLFLSLVLKDPMVTFYSEPG